MGGQSMAFASGLALEVPEYIKAKSREVYGVLPVNRRGNLYQPGGVRAGFLAGRNPGIRGGLHDGTHAGFRGGSLFRYIEESPSLVEKQDEHGVGRNSCAL